MCSIRGTWKNVERKEHLHRNQNETLLRPGSSSLAVRLRMLESEERGRAKAVSGRDELAEEQGRRPRGNWEDGPPKFEVGRRPMHWSPQYFEKQCCRMCVKV